MVLMPLKESVIELYSANRYRYSLFMDAVHNFFSCHPRLIQGDLPAVHSLKKRMKDDDHLRRKIDRKSDADPNYKLLNSQEVFSKFTDLAGVRVLYLHNKQFVLIHETLKKQFDDAEWALHEDPTAFTWDPEVEKFYSKLGIRTEVRDTFYTSVHYIVKPNPSSDITCEIQIRSLYEEIWGEVDHSLNYPFPTQSIACKEQLRVLSKLTSTGTRLLESIFSTIDEYNKTKR